MSAPLSSRLLAALRQEVGQFDVPMTCALALARLLPRYVGVRLRVGGLKMAGLQVGSGTVVLGGISLFGRSRTASGLRIGRDCVISPGCEFDLAGPIDVGDRVTLGHQVMLVTGGHRIGPTTKRAAELVPDGIILGDGCWLGARAMVLPGVTVGRGALVAAGAVVAKDVPADTLVAGVPARPIRELD